MVNDIIFCKSFDFNVFRFSDYKYTDNSAGIHIHYFAYMTRGRARISTEKETVLVNAGDVFYIPDGCKYRSYWYGEPEIEFISLGFRFMPNFRNEQYPPQVIEKSEEIVSAMQRIADTGAPDCAAVGEFYTLVGRLMPRMTCRTEGRQAALIERARRLILAHPEYTVREIAKGCAISESALYAAFHKHSEQSISEIRKTVVMEATRDLLISTDLPIEEIGRRMRFSSSTYFRKCFKDYFGISPRELRKSSGI
jgi:AraC-like DNA-binding protein